jgi:hypothetical protein
MSFIPLLACNIPTLLLQLGFVVKHVVTRLFLHYVLQ